MVDMLKHDRSDVVGVEMKSGAWSGGYSGVNGFRDDFTMQVEGTNREFEGSSELIVSNEDEPLVVDGKLRGGARGRRPVRSRTVETYRRATKLHWHTQRRGLERAGEFFGWIANVSDLEEDSAAGVRNTISVERARQGDTRTARDIAVAGRDVLCEWEELVAPHDASPDLDAVVKTYVASWLGGFSACQ